jgi:hypothetical protein
MLIDITHLSLSQKLDLDMKKPAKTNLAKIDGQKLTRFKISMVKWYTKTYIELLCVQPDQKMALTTTQGRAIAAQGILATTERIVTSPK